MKHIPQHRVTPGVITSLRSHEVFCFGSNEGGRHSRGAALLAKRWGARRSVPNGRSGQTYAIPTKPIDVRSRLCLRDISKYVQEFIEHARQSPRDAFLMTAIGCGLAGYAPSDVAPLFRDAVDLDNVSLPLSFWRALGYT